MLENKKLKNSQFTVLDVYNHVLEKSLQQGDLSNLRFEDQGTAKDKDYYFLEPEDYYKQLFQVAVQHNIALFQQKRRYKNNKLDYLPERQIFGSIYFDEYQNRFLNALWDYTNIFDDSTKKLRQIPTRRDLGIKPKILYNSYWVTNWNRDKSKKDLIKALSAALRLRRSLGQFPEKKGIFFDSYFKLHLLHKNENWYKNLFISSNFQKNAYRPRSNLVYGVELNLEDQALFVMPEKKRDF